MAVNNLSLLERTALVQLLLEELDALEKYVESTIDQDLSSLMDLEGRFSVISQLFQDTGTCPVILEYSPPDYDLSKDDPPSRDGDVIYMDMPADHVSIRLLTPQGDERMLYHRCQDASGKSMISRPSRGRGMIAKISRFVESWRQYLIYVPAAVAYCGEAELRFLKDVEVARTLGVKSESLVEWKASGLLKPVDYSLYYDPIEVARFVAMGSPLLELPTKS